MFDSKSSQTNNVHCLLDAQYYGGSVEKTHASIFAVMTLNGISPSCSGQMNQVMLPQCSLMNCAK